MTTCDRCKTTIDIKTPSENGAIASLESRLCPDCLKTVQAMTTFERLMSAIEQHVPDEDARWSIYDIARELSDEADNALLRAQEITDARDSALMHMDDAQRFGWTDRLTDAYQTLAATC